MRFRLLERHAVGDPARLGRRPAGPGERLKIVRSKLDSLYCPRVEKLGRVYFRKSAFWENGILGIAIREISL